MPANKRIAYLKRPELRREAEKYDTQGVLAGSVLDILDDWAFNYCLGEAAAFVAIALATGSPDCGNESR